MAESTQHKLDRVRRPRVQITYDVETGGAMKKTELPFVSGVLADLSGQPKQPLPPFKERKAVYKDAMKALSEQQPWVFLVAFDRFEAMKSAVKGYVAYPNASQYGLRETWLDK